MNDPKDFNNAVAAEIGRLRLSEIEAGLIVTALSAENEQLKAKIAALEAAAQPIVEQRV